jgi:hypothetical protein
MLFTAHTVDSIEGSSVILNRWLEPASSIHWTLPANDPQYRVSDISIPIFERSLTAADQRAIWAALINSSTLAYEF